MSDNKTVEFPEIKENSKEELPNSNDFSIFDLIDKKMVNNLAESLTKHLSEIAERDKERTALEAKRLINDGKRIDLEKDKLKKDHSFRLINMLFTLIIIVSTMLLTSYLFNNGIVDKSEARMIIIFIIALALGKSSFNFPRKKAN